MKRQGGRKSTQAHSVRKVRSVTYTHIEHNGGRVCVRGRLLKKRSKFETRWKEVKEQEQNSQTRPTSISSTLPYIRVESGAD
eukprot:748886-Hanusia_phi.AAC.3